jgi:hypothetical protein
VITPSYRARFVALTVAAAAGLLGCSSSGSGPADQPPGGETTGQAGTSGGHRTGTAAAPDACALLTDAEVTEVIGTHDGAVPVTGSAPDTSGCTWDHPGNNPTDAKKITLNVSESNTAAGDRLAPPAVGTPPPVPGVGGGARLILVGTLEFPAGGRACSVQVTGLDDDTANRAVAKLAGLVRGRA